MIAKRSAANRSTGKRSLSLETADERRKHFALITEGKATLQSAIEEYRNDKAMLFIAGGDTAVREYVQELLADIAHFGDAARLFP